MFGLVKLWNQIQVERKYRKDNGLCSTEEEFWLRAESNQLLRWAISTVAVLAYVVRVFYFTQGYYLLTYFFGCYYWRQLHAFLFPRYDPMKEASDHRYKSRYISVLFRHKLSSDDFNSLIQRLFEFKFWFTTTRLVLLAFVLTSLPILKCFYYGPKFLLFWILTNGSQFVRSYVKN